MSEENQLKIFARDLKVGMYVAQLDRPWLETPFMFQGFPVRTQADIDLVAEHCLYVYIDIERGAAPPAARIAPGKMGAGKPPYVTEAEPKFKVRQYAMACSMEEELGHARVAYQSLGDVVQNLMEDVRQGKSVALPALQNSLNSMIESVIRNPDAIMWLARLKRQDSYTYLHSLNTSVLAVAIGRKLGYAREDLNDLASGAMLCDIGKMKIDKALLDKPMRYTPEEFAEVRRHVEYGIEILRQSPGINDRILAIIKYHHERHNGRGYPMQLSGSQIPVFSRITAVADCYDAITSSRVYASALSPYEAVLKLYEWRDVDFQAEIIEQFIQAIGIYPTGSLVELSSGQVGVILSQNRLRRLRPRVMLILDENKQPYGNFPILDLIQDETDREGHVIEIACPLKPGAYGIDERDLYL